MVGKGPDRIWITGNVADLETANRLYEMLRSKFGEERKRCLSLDVEIDSTGDSWRFDGAGPIDYGLRHLTE